MPLVTVHDHPSAPPLTLAGRWGGHGHLTELPGLEDGREVHWVDFGGPADDSSSRPPLVLVHGLGGSHLNWVLLAPLLRGQRHVYALDLAGFGLTPGTETTSTVIANTALVAAFLREVVGRPCVLVGNSMGGMISLIVAATRPDVVDRLVLLDPSIPTRRRHLDRRVAATFFLYGVPRVGEAFVGRVTARLSDDQRVQETTNLCFADPRRADPEVHAASVALLAHRQQHAAAVQASFLGAARSILRVLGTKNRYRELIGGIDKLVLLIHGEQDRLVPVAAARQAAADNPSWTSVILPDLGHVPMLEKPDLVAEIITDWLADPR